MSQLSVVNTHSAVGMLCFFMMTSIEYVYYLMFSMTLCWCLTRA